MNVRETGRSRAVSPLDLGGDPLELPPGDDGDRSRQERGAEGGWKALWRLVNDHKSRQALERNAAKKARGLRVFDPLLCFVLAHCFAATTATAVVRFF